MLTVMRGRGHPDLEGGSFSIERLHKPRVVSFGRPVTVTLRKIGLNERMQFPLIGFLSGGIFTLGLEKWLQSV